KTSDKRPTRDEVLAALPQFEGVIQQVPPQFSAIKIDGERAYDLARAGETVEIASREVEIDELNLIDMPDADHVVLEAQCGKGTYVRAIARDLGRVLGCYGHVTELRRTRVGPFNEGNAVSIDALRAAQENAEVGQLSGFLQPVELALDGILELKIDGNDAGRLAMGKAILMRGRDAPIHSGEAYAMCKGRLIALGDIERGEFRPSRVFNLD
ncbi:MAG: tRNA pseudouridine synthase, partial [Pseudomonadota bacterium]